MNKERWLEKTIEWRDKYPSGDFTKTEFVNPYVFTKELSKELRDDDIIFVDCGGNVVFTYQALETKFGQRVISSHGNSPMGFSFAGAIGACIAKPDRRIICIIGDGGFNMNIQELQTIMNYDIRNLRVFILNNRCYGITKMFQETHFGGRFEACGYPKGYNPPAFLPIVHAYGIETHRINSHEKLRENIHCVITSPETIVCDVNIGDWHSYRPRVVGWDTPIDDMEPHLSREELESNRI